VSLPYLTDDEISGVCDGVKLPAAQKRHLKRVGIHFIEKPNGRPLVARSEFERVVGSARLGMEKPPEHNASGVVALRQWAERRKHGTQAKGR
jgi:hypothetical protein